MKNPITHALKLSGTKPIDLSRELNLSRQYISRAEAGMHVNLNLRLSRWAVLVLRETFGDDVELSDVTGLYEGFKNEKRMMNVMKLDICQPLTDNFDFKRPEIPFVIDKLGKPSSGDPFSLISPPTGPVAKKSSSETVKDNFIQWRKRYWGTTYSFANDMCLPPSTIDMYEVGKVTKMPKELRDYFRWLNHG